MEQSKSQLSIASAIEEYLQVVKLARSQNTALTYGKALKEFKKVLVKSKIDPETSPAGMLVFVCRNFLRITLSAFQILCLTRHRWQEIPKLNGYAQCAIVPFC